MQEVAILKKVEEACEDVLARCFENYYALSESAPGGILDGGVATAESPAPALTPAVELAGGCHRFPSSLLLGWHSLGRASPFGCGYSHAALPKPSASRECLSISWLNIKAASTAGGYKLAAASQCHIRLWQPQQQLCDRRCATLLAGQARCPYMEGCRKQCACF